MKLTEREEKLLFVLGIVVVIMVGYKFMLGPARVNYEALTLEVEKKRNQEMEAKKVLAVADTIDADITQVIKESEQASQLFFKRADVEYIHKWISMLASSNNLLVKSLNIQEESLVTVDVYGNTFTPISYPIGDYYEAINDITSGKMIAQEEVEEGSSEQQEGDENLVPQLREDDAVLQMSIDVSVTGTNGQLMNFVDYLSNLGKHIVVQNFTFEDRQSTDIQELSVSLVIYSINKEKEDVFKGYFLNE